MYFYIWHTNIINVAQSCQSENDLVLKRMKGKPVTFDHQSQTGEMTYTFNQRNFVGKREYLDVILVKNSLLGANEALESLHLEVKRMELDLQLLPGARIGPYISNNSRNRAKPTS